jgi:hypothetical protein
VIVRKGSAKGLMSISGLKKCEGGSERDFLCFTVIGGRGDAGDTHP